MEDIIMAVEDERNDPMLTDIADALERSRREIEDVITDLQDYMDEHYPDLGAALAAEFGPKDDNGGKYS